MFSQVGLKVKTGGVNGATTSGCLGGDI